MYAFVLYFVIAAEKHVLTSGIVLIMTTNEEITNSFPNRS